MQFLPRSCHLSERVGAMSAAETIVKCADG